MLIYNSRTQQKWLTFFTGAIFDLSFIIIFFLGEMYKNERDTLIMTIIITGTLLSTFIVYFLLIKLANSMFIFDKTGFVRKMNKKVVLKVKWEDVISIGTYHIYDFFKIDCGPLFLAIDYYDENHNEQSLNVAFSAKDAKRLKMSRLNEKLHNII